MFDLLVESPVFKGLNQAELENLFQGVIYSVRTYEKGQTIASRGENCDHLIVLVDGSVKGEMLDYSGKIVKIEDIPAPNTVASAFLFGNHNQYPVDVVATAKSRLLFIPRESVLFLLQASRDFLNNFLNMISNRTQFLSSKIFFLSFRTIKGKLAQFLLNLASDNRTQVTLPKSQEDIASLFGVARPSFARALGELEKEGVLQVHRREVRILDRERLISLLK